LLSYFKIFLEGEGSGGNGRGVVVEPVGSTKYAGLEICRPAIDGVTSYSRLRVR
jgi:hypothetical protein